MNRKSLYLAAACSLAYAAVAAHPPALAQEQPAANAAVAMREVDIRAFIEDVSNATGRTFIVDPRVSGKVTVMAHEALSQRELFDVFMTTLRVHGFVAVPTANGAYRIIPDAVAAREPSAPSAGPADNRYVSQVFTLHFADAESVAAAIKPMLSERGQATASRRGNSVVVVDYGSTLSRLRDVIARLDRDNSAMRTIQLKNTSAAEMARVAQGLAPGGAGDAGARSLVQAIPVASSNSLVLRGDPRTLDQIAPVIQQLDAGADQQSGVQVIPLQYAVAEEILPVLQQISSSMTGGAVGVIAPENGAAGGENGAPAAENAAPGPAAAGRRANIAAHRATNSIIISSDPETREALAKVVRSLDVRREQILVEAIIVEVSDEAARELGLQFLAAGDGTKDVPFISTNYSNSAPNLLAITGALLTGDNNDDDDDNSALRDLRNAAISSLLNARGILAGFGGQTSNGSIFGLILNALAEDKDSNVLSTPSVMTLNNETASILVGQQIPVTTGETLSDNNDNPFRTVRREDVGVQLQVRPQISQGGAIRLNIKQEVSSIFGPIVTDSTDLITNRRAIETVVQVDAGQVVVLGGLIQDEVQRTTSGIPILRSIPVMGRLFRSEGKSRKRTNLMVFLRPTIVTTAEQARAITERQYRTFRGSDGFDPGLARELDRQLQAQPPSRPAPPAGTQSNNPEIEIEIPVDAGAAPPQTPPTPPNVPGQ